MADSGIDTSEDKRAFAKIVLEEKIKLNEKITYLVFLHRVAMCDPNDSYGPDQI